MRKFIRGHQHVSGLQCSLWNRSHHTSVIACLPSKKAAHFFGTIFPSFLNPAGVAFGAGEIGVLGIDVHEIVAFRIHLLELFAAALRENEVT